MTGEQRERRPNVLLVVADELRAQAVGHGGDADAETPTLDAFAAQAVDFTNAVSGTPVCCPARASLLTGQYPLTHGVYVNDVELRLTGTTLGEAFRDAGYRTGWIGKWHLRGSPDGHYGRRTEPVPADARFGFDHWQAAECTHDYWRSWYFEGDDPERKWWDGYDAFAQTEAACRFVEDAADDPYLLVLSWGPPHFPLDTAPDRFRERYADRPMRLRPNVPPSRAEEATEALRGYHAHLAALDESFGTLLAAVERSGRAEDTIVVFTSDHGDMLGSQGLPPDLKLVPWDESVRVPLYVRLPGGEARQETGAVNTPDLMPTLLGLCGLPVPAGVQGRDVLAPSGADGDRPEGAFLSMVAPTRLARTLGIGEYRGVRTERHTYVRSRLGPWLLYDDAADPYQLHNLVGDPAYEALVGRLDATLARWLAALGDGFEAGEAYLERDGLTHYHEVNDPVGSSEGPGGTWRSTMAVPSRS